MAKITGIDHVQVAMPAGSEPQAVAFYNGKLGLPQITKPAHLAVRGGVWFQCGPAQLHLGGDAAFQPAKKAHPALTIDGFEEFMAGLAAKGVDVTPDEMVAGLRRATVFDPFGNRVELIEQR